MHTDDIHLLSLSVCEAPHVASQSDVKRFVSDTTNWRKMLGGPPEARNLFAERDALLESQEATDPSVTLPGRPIEDAESIDIEYPVSEYPSKVVSHNLDKNPKLEGTLMGIKGQYLIFDSAVINVRKYGGYHVELAD